VDGVIVGHEIALPGIFFAGVAGLHTALAQGKKDGVLKAMADIRREVRRIHAPERVVDRVVFVRRHDPLLKRQTKLRNREQQVGVLQKLDGAGSLGYPSSAPLISPIPRLFITLSAAFSSLPAAP